MKVPRQPLYLARDTYRRRRAMDAVRLLPFLGLFLMMLPLLWEDSAGPGQATAREGLYLFAVWAGLILAAALLAPVLSDAPDDPEPRSGGDTETPADGTPGQHAVWSQPPPPESGDAGPDVRSPR